MDFSHKTDKYFTLVPRGLRQGVGHMFFLWPHPPQLRHWSVCLQIEIKSYHYYIFLYILIIAIENLCSLIGLTISCPDFTINIGIEVHIMYKY